MADDPQNPGGNNPVKSYGSPLGQGAGTPPAPAVANPLQGAVGALSSEVADSATVLSNVQELVKLLNQLKEPSEKQDAAFKKWSTNLKFAVAAVEDVADKTKEVLEISKKFSREGIAGLNKKSYTEVKKYLVELKKSQEDLRDSLKDTTKDGGVEYKKLKKVIEATTEAVDELEKSTDAVKGSMDDLDPAVLGKIARAGRQAHDEIERLGTSLGRRGQVSRGIQDLSKIMGSGMFEKFSRAGGIATELGKWKVKAQKEGKAGFAQLQTDFAKRYKIRKEGGAPEDRLSELVAYRRTQAGREAGAGGISGRGGLGGIFDRMAERAAGGEGLLARQATATLQAGGGRFGAGLGMRALSGVAGGGVGAMELAGRAAVPLAILDAMRKLVDSVGEDNRELMRELGTGGLFTGAMAGQTAQDRLQAARANLQPVAFSSLAVRREDNLKIIKAIEDLGVALPELGVKQEATGAGILQGGARGFGGVQELAYRQGRQLGMDTGETARENIKYLLQFHQGQAAVNKLFDQFLKDTRASGITTTKYLSIIDEINSQFDRMGKSLMTTTGLLSVLGSTGTATADDLKEALGVLVGGPAKSLEQTAYLYATMSQKDREQLAMGLRTGVGVQRGTALGALQEIKLDAGSLETIDDVRLAIQKLNADTRVDAKGQAMRDTINGKASYQALQDLERQMMMAEHARKFAAGEETAVDYAESIKLLGNATTKMTTNIAGVFSVLEKSGAKLDDVMAGRTSTALMAKVAEALGVDPKAVTDELARLLSLLGGATRNALATQPKGFTDEGIEKMFAFAVEKGFTAAQPAGTVDTKRAALAAVAADKVQGPKLAVALETNADLLKDVSMGNSDVVKAVQSAMKPAIPTPENIANVTRTTGDLITDALARGFVLLADGVTRIADFLQRHFGTSEEKFDAMLKENPAAAQAEAAKQKFWSDKGTMNDAWTAIKASVGVTTPAPALSPAAAVAAGVVPGTMPIGTPTPFGKPGAVMTPPPTTPIPPGGVSPGPVQAVTGTPLDELYRRTSNLGPGPTTNIVTTNIGAEVHVGAGADAGTGLNTSHETPLDQPRKSH
jgi:hypothetical protein